MSFCLKHYSKSVCRWGRHCFVSTQAFVCLLGLLRLLGFLVNVVPDNFREWKWKPYLFIFLLGYQYMHIKCVPNLPIHK